MVRKRKIPQRMCLGCREIKDKKELIRIVRTPAGDIELDNTGKKAGRGAYICPKNDCFLKAINNRGLEKSLHRKLPENILALLKDQLERPD
ncbi:MAG: RNase P modulator RnpM [Dethiobacteria bacterium]|jgi:predicted RNA-binding protein YlxR (DUF448 family)